MLKQLSTLALLPLLAVPLLVRSVDAQGQSTTSYTVQAAPKSYYQTSHQYGYNCNGPVIISDVALDPNTNYAQGVLSSGVCISRKGGQWIPNAAPTGYGWTTPNGFPTTLSTSNATLDANGVITQYGENLGFYPFNSTTEIGLGNDLETVNLNTGHYSQSFIARDIWGYGTSCPRYSTDYGQYDVAVQLTFIANASGCNSIQAVDPRRASNPSSIFPLNQSINATAAANAQAAYSIAADGQSAVAIVFQSNSSAQTTFTLSSSGTTGSIGTLTGYDPNYLTDGPGSGGLSTNPISPISDCSPGGTCTFIALLWAPSKLPTNSAAAFSGIPLTVTATQGSNTSTTTISLLPPPVVLIHGIWSHGYDWGPFGTWLAENYPHRVIHYADYTQYNSQAFDSAGIQQSVALAIVDAIQDAANQGFVSTQVDVVAHSMGGLATRYLVEKGPPSPYHKGDSFPASPIHKVITVGTPNLGSALAPALIAKQDNPLILNASPLVAGLCLYFTNLNCTLGGVFGALQKPIGTGVASLDPAYTGTKLSAAIEPHSAIVGEALQVTATGLLLDAVITAFAPGETFEGILGTASPNDTIVSEPSQAAGSTGVDEVVIQGVIHASICVDASLIGNPNGTNCVDSTETHDTAVWQQILKSLEGNALQGTVPALAPARGIPSSRQETMKPIAPPAAGSFGGMHLHSPAQHVARTSEQPEASPEWQEATPASTSPAPTPFFDLTGYNQTSAANVVFSPVSQSTISLGSPTTITATSSGKTITEVLAFQQVSDPLDTSLFYATQSPFTLTVTPLHPGTVNLVVFAVFSDKTYATTTLTYQTQLTGGVTDIRFPNPPIAPLMASQSVYVSSLADSPNAVIDVTKAATYTARSGTTNVFSVGSNGQITANGDGQELLDVSYGGVTGSTLITVGNCTYSLTPISQIVDYSGSSASVGVSTQAGCSWTGTSDSAWLSLSTLSGTGSGAITASASSNTTGATRYAYVQVAGQSVLITQPSVACSYSVSPSSLTLTSSGGKGTLALTTACPAVASSDQTWADAVVLNPTSVEYVVDANTVAQPRTANLTIGSVIVPVTEAGIPDFSVTGSTTSIAVKAGQSGTIALSLTPLNGFSQAIALSCSGLPTGASCSFSPATFTPSASSTTDTLTVAVASTSGRNEGPAPLWPAGGGITVALCFIVRLRRSRSYRMLLVLAGAFALCGAVIGCGGSSGSLGGGGSTTSTVTVTATSGALQHSTTFSLTIP
jgi:triacylglycerol esterase/lipase EstA (alpha/beta hydrolase family)